MTFPEENTLFAGVFGANLDKKMPIWFNLQRDGTGNRLPNTKDTCRKFAATNVSSAPK